LIELNHKERERTRTKKNKIDAKLRVLMQGKGEKAKLKRC